jgi:hypothetical protein
MKSLNGLNLLIPDLNCVKKREDAVLLNLDQLTGIWTIWTVKRCILYSAACKCDTVIMQENLQLTLAIIKPHVTKAPHALQVGIILSSV